LDSRIFIKPIPSLKLFKFLLGYLEMDLENDICEFIKHQDNLEIIEWLLDNTSISITRMLKSKVSEYDVSLFLSRATKIRDFESILWILVVKTSEPMLRDEKW